jgi:hypothetical protein
LIVRKQVTQSKIKFTYSKTGRCSGYILTISSHPRTENIELCFHVVDRQLGASRWGTEDSPFPQKLIQNAGPKLSIVQTSEETQVLLASHIDKIHFLDSFLTEHDIIKAKSLPFEN